MKIEYVVQGEGFPERARDISGFDWIKDYTVDDILLKDMACKAASHHLKNHVGRGYLDRWPVTFEIYIDGKKRGVFEVEKETVPEFTAKEIKGKGL